MCSFKSIYFVIFILNLYKTNAQISDKRLCVDPDCKEPVSLARTLIRYSSPDARILSFAPNVNVTIYSKEAGSETSLWGAVINGKRGYIPKHLVREYKVLKVPKLLVDTEFKQKPQVLIDVNKENVEPNRVQESFEVVDGTTIYLNPQDGISPSSTESPILSTTTPSGGNEAKGNAEILNSVEDSKEKNVQKDNKEESVVENAISSFSNWISDDLNSEEIEDFEDDDEGEDDEEEDEDEESLEENINSQEKSQSHVNESISEKTEDMNLLHNLPLGVNVSPYNFELDHSVKENVEKETAVLKENIVLQQEPKIEAPSAAPPSLESNKNNPLLPEIGKIEPVAEIKPQVVENNTPTNVEANKPEKQEQIKKEIDDRMISNPVKIETVTEATFAEEDLLPILDPVTPNPVELKTEEAVNAEDSSSPLPNKNQNQQTGSLPPPTATVGSSNANVEEKLGLKSQTPLDVAQRATASSAENKPVSTDGSEKSVLKEEQKTPTSFVPPPTLGGLFDKAQNLLQHENAANEQAEIPVGQSVNVDNSKKLESTLKEDFASVEKIVEDVSAEESTNAGNLSTASIEELSSEAKVVNEVVKEESTHEGSVVNVLKEVVIEEKIAEEVLKEEATDEGNVENDASEEYSTNEGEILPESKEDFVNTIKDVPNEILNEENVILPKEDNIDLDYASKEETEENPLEEEVPNYDQKPTNEENIEKLLNEGVDNIETFDEERSSDVKESAGFLSGLFSFFGSDVSDNSSSVMDTPFSSGEEEKYSLEDNVRSSEYTKEAVDAAQDYCDTETEVCASQRELSKEKGLLEGLELHFNPDILLYLITTAISVILFLFGYMALDRSKREAPLVARINKLEKQLLVTLKENELLQENGSSALVQGTEDLERLAQRLAEMELTKLALEHRVADLEKQLEEKEGLEEQIESLEKELETSTEVGMELNRIISEMLDPTNGSDRLKENVEQLQRQLLEQKDTINTINESLRDKEAEKKTLRAELGRHGKKVIDLQNRADETAEKILKIEKEKDQQQNTLQNEVAVYQQKYSEAVSREDILSNDIQALRVQLSEVQRLADIKAREYQTLRESLDKIKSMKNDSNTLRSLLDTTSIKAELQQLKAENEKYVQQLQQEQTLKADYEKKYQAVVGEINVIKLKYEQADKEKVEVNSKLEVLNNYFKKREAELQEEVIKYKSIWDVKEGEATSTTERIKYMQEEIGNYKAQNEALKQEIISQEIELKSQISMLEKKVHENWVVARQTDRKLEDARQEAAQLRNRLTLRERAIYEERSHNRLQSPLEQNGEMPLSPHPIDSPASPPLLYGRDHITKSPPLPGLPPFLPPPPGAPFMPPPIHGMPPFIPPPLYPADHRPPPLGRMSSPPLNSRYSPDNLTFSPYERNSPSPLYDSEYGASPPPIRGYSPYNSRDDRIDYKRPPHNRTNGRNLKGSRVSSGSDHSNDSLDQVNRKQSKMV